MNSTERAKNEKVYLLLHVFVCGVRFVYAMSRCRHVIKGYSPARCISR